MSQNFRRCKTSNYGPMTFPQPPLSPEVPLPPLPPEPLPPPPPPTPPRISVAAEFKGLLADAECNLRCIYHITDMRRGREDPTLKTAMVEKTQLLVNYVKQGRVQLWEMDEICDILIRRLTQASPFSPMARVLHWVLIYIAKCAYVIYKNEEEFTSAILRILKKVDKVFLRTARFSKIEQEPYLIEELVAMLSRLPLSETTFLSPEVPRLLRRGWEFLWPFICDKSSNDHTYFLEGKERETTTDEYIQFRRIWNLMRGWKGGVLKQKRQEYYDDVIIGTKLLVALTPGDLVKIDKMIQFLEPFEPSIESELHPLSNSEWREGNFLNFQPIEWATYYIVLLWTASRAFVQMKLHSKADCRFVLRRIIKLINLGVEAIQQCGANGEEIWRICLDIFGTSRNVKWCKCEAICDKVKTAFPNDYPASLEAQTVLRNRECEEFFFPNRVMKRKVEGTAITRTRNSPTLPPLETDFRSASEKAVEEAKKFAAGFQHLAQLALMEGQESGEVETAVEPEIVEVVLKRRKEKGKKRYLAKVDAGGKKDAAQDNGKKKSANFKKEHEIMIMPALPSLTLTEILDCGKSKKMRREFGELSKCGYAANNDPQGEGFPSNLWPIFCPRDKSSMEYEVDHGRIHGSSRKVKTSKNKGNKSLPLEKAAEDEYVIVAMKNPFCISDFIDLEILSKKQGLRQGRCKCDLKIVYFLPKSKESSKWFRRYRRKWRRGGCRCDVYKECDSLLSPESYQSLLSTGEHSPIIDANNSTVFSQETTKN